MPRRLERSAGFRSRIGLISDEDEYVVKESKDTTAHNESGGSSMKRVYLLALGDDIFRVVKICSTLLLMVLFLLERYCSPTQIGRADISVRRFLVGSALYKYSRYC